MKLKGVVRGRRNEDDGEDRKIEMRMRGWRLNGISLYPYQRDESQNFQDNIAYFSR